MLSTKKCTNCETCFVSYAKTPYCRQCIKNVCCMSHNFDCDGRISCNCTFDVYKYQNKNYCLGHFKTLQNKCAVCNITRPESATNFQSDYLWYCKHHIPQKKPVVSETWQTLKDTLCVDVILKILSYVYTPIKYRYPDDFNIPLKKPLK